MPLVGAFSTAVPARTAEFRGKIPGFGAARSTMNFTVPHDGVLIHC